MKNIIKTSLIALIVGSGTAFSTLAMTIANSSGTAIDNVRTGVVESVTPGASIQIDGTTYVFHPALATIRDDAGKALANFSLIKGTAVRFVSKPDGSRQRITELWILKK